MRNLRNQIGVLFLLCLTCVMMVMAPFTELTALALGDYTDGLIQPERFSRLVDTENLLDTDEQKELEAKLDEISERHQCDVVIVTIDTLGERNAQEYADDFYDAQGYGFGENHDGILLLVAMNERRWAMSTTGWGIQVFTDAGLDYISEAFRSKLSEGDYAEAFDTFANLCDNFIAQAAEGQPYDVNNMPKVSFLSRLLTSIIPGVILGIIAALIHSFSMRHASNGGVIDGVKNADVYITKEGILFTGNRSRFIRSEVLRHYNPPQKSSGGGGSSTHIGSSGTSHGGSSGGF